MGRYAQASRRGSAPARSLPALPAPTLVQVANYPEAEWLLAIVGPMLLDVAIEWERSPDGLTWSPYQTGFLGAGTESADLLTGSELDVGERLRARVWPDYQTYGAPGLSNAVTVV